MHKEGGFMAYEILGRKTRFDLAASKGEPGDKGEKGEKGLRGEDEYPRSIDIGPAFDDGTASTAVAINVSPLNGDNETYAGWMSKLDACKIAIDVASAAGRYKSDSLWVPLEKVLWYRYHIVGPGKIGDIRLETGEDGYAVFTCQWDGLKGDVPFIKFDALVVFEYIVDDQKSYLVEEVAE